MGPRRLRHGATIGSALHAFGLRDALAASNAPILAPGFGAQGSTVESLRDVFGKSTARVIPTTSRDVLKAGPDVASLVAVVERTRESVAGLAGGTTHTSSTAMWYPSQSTHDGA